jgi:hypothetical protein
MKYLDSNIVSTCQPSSTNRIGKLYLTVFPQVALRSAMTFVVNASTAA